MLSLEERVEFAKTVALPALNVYEVVHSHHFADVRTNRERGELAVARGGSHPGSQTPSGRTPLLSPELCSRSQKHSSSAFPVWGCVENSPFKEFKEVVVEVI